jgi:hypothetical protein
MFLRLLRRPFHVRIVLAWFILAIAAAAVAPLLAQPQHDTICGDPAAASEQAPAALHVHTLECPLCAVGNVPPPALLAFGEARAEPAVTPAAIEGGAVHAFAAAPPPARAPPSAA